MGVDKLGEVIKGTSSAIADTTKSAGVGGQSSAKNKAVLSIAGQAFGHMAQDTESAGLFDILKRGWKVITDFFSDIARRIAAIFSSAKGEGSPDSVNQKNHVSALAQQVLTSAPRQEKKEGALVSDVPKTTTKEPVVDGEAKRLMATLPLAALPSNEADSLDSDSVEDSGSFDYSDDIDVPETSGGGDAMDVASDNVLASLIGSLVDAKHDLEALKWESYGDVRQVIQLLADLEEKRQLLSYIESTAEGLSEGIKNQEKELEDTLQQTAAAVDEQVIQHSGVLNSLYQTAESDKDRFVCADLLLRYGLMDEEKQERTVARTEKTNQGAGVLANSSPPVGLINSMWLWPGVVVGRNACYRNAVNQALLMPFFGKQLAEQLSGVGQKNAYAFESEEKIGEALQNLWNCQQRQGVTPEELLEADEQLLHEISNSGLMSDLYAGNKYRQQDAAAYLGMLLNHVLNFKMPIERQHVGKYDGQIIEGSKRPDTDALLQIAPGASFQEAINGALNERVQDWSQAWETRVGKDTVFIDDYTIQTRIRAAKPLDVVVMQVKRMQWGQGGYNVDYTPMALDEDDCVDLSAAYDGLSAGAARYRLKSFVWFQGGVTSDKGDSAGHYIAYVNKGGVWYECNDRKVSVVDPGLLALRKQELYCGVFEKVS